MKKYDLIIKKLPDEIIELTVTNEHIEMLKNSISKIFNLTCKIEKIKDCTLTIRIANENKTNFFKFLTIICYLKNLKLKTPPTYTETIETEVKILEVDRKKIVQKILSLGGKKVFENDITTTWFDYPDRSIKKADKVIRVKKVGEIYIISYKGVTQNSDKSIAKIRNEVESKIDNYKELIKFLNNLNLYSTDQKEKHRISYQLDKNLIEFDKMSKPIDIPEFLEIEGKNIEEILKCAKKIGYTKEDFKSWGSKKLIEHYRTLFKKNRTKEYKIKKNIKKIHLHGDGRKPNNLPREKTNPFLRKK